MSSESIGIICIIVLIGLMYLRMRVGLAMLFVGFWGIVAIVGWDISLEVLARVPYTSIAVYTIAVVPLFILMGVVLSNTRVAADLYYSAHKWIGQLRGGLAMASVMACAAFAAVVSISVAATITMGKAALPEMKKYKYSDGLAAGCIAAGGTLGILIPPSIAFILYGILTETSIGALFLAGIIPGILEAALYMATIYIICRFKPGMGPPGPKTSLKEKISSLKNTWATVLLILLVLGGIYGGVFTPTEAGAVGAFGAIVIALSARRLNKQNFTSSILETAQMTAMIVLLIVGAFTFIKLMALSKLPFMMSDFVAGLPLPPYLILVAIIFMYIILGMFLDVMSCILLTVPILFPVAQALGFDPIWYGVLMVRVIEMGLITPPIGMDVFMLSGTSGVPIGTVFRGVIPFVVADVLHVALLVAFPAISLFLPSMMS